MALTDRLKDWRNRLLSSPKFQSRAAAFPLTRPIARRNAAALFNLCAGFVYSQVLLACTRLDIFPLLQKQPLTLEGISAHTGLPAEGTERLVRAAVALDLLEPRSGARFGLGPQGAALMGNPSVLAMIRHHGAFYLDLADPVELLKGRTRETRLARFWGYAGSDAPEKDTADGAAPYSELMAETQTLIAREILSAYDISQHRHVMDVGGGSGAFLIAAAAAAPDLKLTLCDLPAVAELARARFSEAGLAGRAEAVGRDAFRETLPEGADLITLIRILHDHDDEAVRTLLQKVRTALAPGGKLLIAEPMADTAGAKAMGDAYFGLYLWTMGSGRPRRAEEIEAMLAEAGFSNTRQIATRQPLLTRMILAGQA